jgi:hypothetical protein
MGLQATTLRHTSKELRRRWMNSRIREMVQWHGINEMLRWMKADLQNAGEHIRTQMNGLGKELNRTIVLLCCAAIMIGVFVGMLYRWWVDAPLSQPASPPVPAVQAAPPSSPDTPLPNHKKRPQSNVPAQQ